MNQSSRKLTKLQNTLRMMRNVAVAFSAGVDSTFLLKVCSDVLHDKVVAITATSWTYPDFELKESRRLAKMLRVKHIVVRTSHLENERFLSNPPERCYYCRKALFTKLWEVAHKMDARYLLDGSNLDDARDYRPGSRAAKDLHVRSPLREVGLTKNEIRNLSRRMRLPTAEKPSTPCLASRIPYGDRITREKLSRIERAEEIVKAIGIRLVRVRHHGNVARIEIPPKDFPKLLAKFRSKGIARKMRSIGYDYVTLDLEGYQMGSMNRPVEKLRRANLSVARQA